MGFLPRHPMLFIHAIVSVDKISVPEICYTVIATAPTNYMYMYNCSGNYLQLPLITILVHF